MRKVGDKGAYLQHKCKEQKDATEAYEIGKDYTDHYERVTLWDNL